MVVTRLPSMDTDEPNRSSENARSLPIGMSTGNPAGYDAHFVPGCPYNEQMLTWRG
jgi:hypothetical protein